MKTTNQTTNTSPATTYDRCDKNPASPGRLEIEEADDHTPEFGSYELVAIDNQHECVARVHTCCGRERANAEKLARAWNSHEALVAALEDSAACMDALCIALSPRRREVTRIIIDRAREALKGAK